MNKNNKKASVFLGNKLIADFMEWKSIVCSSPKDYYYIPDGFELIIEEETTYESNWGWFLIQQDECSIKDMKFNTSWDWLIPVIDKIYSLDVYSVYVNTTSGQFENSISINTRFIKNTYVAVIEFIKWYNNENR